MGQRRQVEKKGGIEQKKREKKDSWREWEERRG